MEAINMGIEKQINKGNATVNNIEQQFNYYYTGAGTAFIPWLNTREEKNFIKIKNLLYYPPNCIESAISVLETERVILIEGAQGSGKSLMSFKIADTMCENKQINIYYLNPPSDWNFIKQWIDSIRIQNRLL